MTRRWPLACFVCLVALIGVYPLVTVRGLGLLWALTPSWNGRS